MGVVKCLGRERGSGLVAVEECCALAGALESLAIPAPEKSGTGLECPT